MPFIHIEGEDGQFYVPENDGKKKHPCKDCFSCQWCDDDRCAKCLKRRPHPPTPSPTGEGESANE